MRSPVLARSLAALGLVAGCAATSCVPASEPADAAGAIGFVTEPTAASLGEPFTTDDGWTVRIELLVMQLRVSASTSYDGEGRARYSGDSAEYRFAARERVELYGRGLEVGLASATAILSGGYIGEDAERFQTGDRLEIVGVPPEASARFRRPADASAQGGSYGYRGPSVLVVARGEKAGRVVTIDFTIAAYGYSSDGEPTISAEIRADALTVAPLAVVGEALFVDEARGELLFEPFANADQDGDGVMTGAELGATSTFALGGVTGPRTLGLVDVLYERAGRLLVAR